MYLYVIITSLLNRLSCSGEKNALQFKHDHETTTACRNTK